MKIGGPVEACVLTRVKIACCTSYFPRSKSMASMKPVILVLLAMAVSYEGSWSFRECTRAAQLIASFFDEPTGIAHESLEDLFTDSALKPMVHGAFGAEFGWKILPFGPVVENPEDALNDLSFVGRRAASKRASPRVWNPFRKQIQLRRCEC